jgi:hypothetical protein
VFVTITLVNRLLEPVDDVVRETGMNARIEALLANPLYGCPPDSKSPPRGLDNQTI